MARLSKNDVLKLARLARLELNVTEVDEYIAECEAMGKELRKAYRGTFNVRLSPELHRQAAEIAASFGVSLNQFVSIAIDYAVRHPKIFEVKKDVA